MRLDPALLRIDPSAFIAQGAVVLGDVHVGPDAGVWFGAIIRGDTEQIRIGARTNIQDGTVVHADPGFPCLLGDDVTVGHRCVVHGARVGDRCLIGMSSTLMNGAELGEECVVGAGALITEGKRIPPRSLVLGVPGRVIRRLTDDDMELWREGSRHYAEAARQYVAAGYGAPRR
ncbi:MAG: gamma carbonic anhydrase family protein [Polyangiaceae bacterium]|nr:gamma carbonic anhydrase family protein [Polyangiaceae bacterium]